MSACDVCGQAATKAGVPYDARMLALHRAQQHKIAGKTREQSLRSAKTKAEKLKVEGGERCDICGATSGHKGTPYTKIGVAIHKAQMHGVPGKTNNKAHRAHPSAGLVHVPTARNGHRLNGAGELAPLDIALAVLSKVTPDGRIAVADLPEVLTWIEQTHTVIDRVSTR